MLSKARDLILWVMHTNGEEGCELGIVVSDCEFGNQIERREIIASDRKSVPLMYS